MTADTVEGLRLDLLARDTEIRHLRRERRALYALRWAEEDLR